MKCLVTGGAGYIGATTAYLLLENGHNVVILDDLRTGHREMIDRRATWVNADVCDQRAVEALFETHDIDVVFHFAAYIQVGESMLDPGKYFENNTVGVLRLLEAMRICGVRQLIYSSTAAVYGHPTQVPIDENSALAPINPYGASKRMGEEAIEWYAKCAGIRSMRLRYFNVGGAVAHLGECHEPETHLLPIILEVATGKRPVLKIFGDDYPTPDGTCIRDYLHVEDLATAHLLAMENMPVQTDVCNLGTGTGYSVLEMVKRVEAVSGRAVPVEIAARRPGDPPSLVASAERAAKILGWRPKKSLDQMISSQLQWLSQK